MTIRKNITLKQEDYDLISNFILKKGYNFSEFLRETALERIKQEEEISLLDFLNSNISLSVSYTHLTLPTTERV